MAPVRNRSLALAACCAVAAPATAQSLPPLKVDPALLGIVRAPLPAELPRPAPLPLAEPSSNAAVAAPVEAAVPSASRALPASPVPRDGESGLRAQLPVLIAPSTPPAPPAVEPAPQSPAPRPTLAVRRDVEGPAADDSTELLADEVSGVNDAEMVAEGRVELRQKGAVVTADRVVYRQIEDEIEATGNVRYARDGNEVFGDRMQMRIGEQVGVFESPAYVLRGRLKAIVPSGFDGEPAQTRRTSDARGSAARIRFEGENQFALEDATYSTCKPGDHSWYARITDLHLDYDEEEGSGRGAAIYFKDVPIFYAPWLWFPLNDQRVSGFLPPTIGSTSLSGSEVTIPYYWNIAPHMDATIAPRLYSKRGMQLNNEFRYLGEQSLGQVRVEYLGSDQLRQFDRWGIALSQQGSFTNGFTSLLNINRVSDDFYYRDLSTRISNSAQTQLIGQGIFGYSGGWWSAQANVLKYQTLQPDPANLVAEPYDLLPQVSADARRNIFGGFEFSFSGQYTRFAHRDQTRIAAGRTMLYPQISWPLTTPAFYLTPKVGLHATRYTFDRGPAALGTRFSRDVPVVSVDSGLTFERATDYFGQMFTQTLEPRLYYLYVPYRDQSVLSANGVNFDTTVADFNFAQIFSENSYAGVDRIADANQVTAALTSRLIDPDTGAETIKAMVGQRYYFDTQAVTLTPADTPRTARKTDLLAAVSGRIGAKTLADAAWQYNPKDARSERFSLAMRYQPESGRALNAAYRYGRTQAAPFSVSLKQIDVSGQWPLFGAWQAAGRYNYSLNERRLIEAIGGLEYLADCWRARVVLQRYAVTASTASSAVFFQLELNDFSRLGSNPLELLKRNIPGYGQPAHVAADPVFGAD